MDGLEFTVFLLVEKSSPKSGPLLAVHPALNVRPQVAVRLHRETAPGTGPGMLGSL